MSTLENDPPAGPASAEAPATPPASAEQFIPLRKSDLARQLAAKLSGPDREGFERVARLLEAVIHARLHALVEELKDAYAPFDPDSDTREGEELNETQLDERRAALFAAFERVLERGNFIRLAENEINAALKDRSHWGLHLKVNFDVFDRLELFARGDIIGTRYRRRLGNRFQPEEVSVPIYQRLVVIFRLRGDQRLASILDTRDVYIKLFKDIPKLDLDMLLPGTQVRMSILDRLRIMLPTLSGLAIAVYKILLVAAAPLYTSLAFLGLVGGTVGYGVRSLYGYLNTRQKYQLNLTQSLYYQNIDNNAGVIHRLIDEAEEQENREALLAYFFLWRKAPPAGWTAGQLDAAIEEFLRQETGRAVDFEIGDALAKLERFGVVTRQGELWQAPEAGAAAAALAEHCHGLVDGAGG